MPEHATHIEEFLRRSSRAQRDSELFQSWCGEDPQKRVWADFENFKKTDQWDNWSKREVQKISLEDTAARLLGMEVDRLEKLESTTPATPAAQSKLPDFVVKDGSKETEQRWKELEKDCMGEVCRRSNSLRELWDGVSGPAIMELKAEGKLTPTEIQDLQGAIGNVYKDLEKWDKEAGARPTPDLQPLFRDRAHFMAVDTFIKRHTALFDKIDGQKSPTAKYKVLATFRAIQEMQTRQARNRGKPPLYSKMLDRLNEISGRQPVPDEMSKKFLKQGFYFENPHKVLEEFITGARADLNDKAKLVSAEFYERFRKLNSDPKDDWRPAINYQRGLKTLTEALTAWSKMKITWPPTEQRFEAASRIAWAVQSMKQSINEGLAVSGGTAIGLNEGLSGSGDTARAIRERYHAVLDGVVERISTELTAIQ